MLELLLYAWKALPIPLTNQSTSYLSLSQIPFSVKSGIPYYLHKSDSSASLMLVALIVSQSASCSSNFSLFNLLSSIYQSLFWTYTSKLTGSIYFFCQSLISCRTLFRLLPNSSCSVTCKWSTRSKNYLFIFSQSDSIKLLRYRSCIFFLSAQLRFPFLRAVICFFSISDLMCPSS